MEEIIYSISLDLRQNTHKVLVMKEGDYNSRVIEATITDNGKPFNIENCTVDIKWRKPDGHLVYSESTKINSSTIRVVCTEQMLCVSGISVAEVVITDSNSVVSTLSFNISVNETVASDFDIESSDEFGSLRQMKEHIANNSIHIPEGGTAGQAVVKDENGNVTWGEVSGGSSGDYLEKNNPSGTGSFSMNRKAGSTVGDYSSAEGYNCAAGGIYAHAEGYYTSAHSYGSHAEGSSTTAIDSSAHAEGYDTTASGSYSHAEGGSTTASGSYGSHAEGRSTTASGSSSHAEGYKTTASGYYSHAEGYYTTASGKYGSHAEGSTTEASGEDGSHAEGKSTAASGSASHAEGYYTMASGKYQHVQGKYNVEDSENKYAHIVGGGTSLTDRKNIHTLDWQGNAVFAGDVTYNKSISLSEMIQNLCLCIGTFKEAEIVSRSHNELGEVKMACIPYSECSVLTTSNKIAVKFTNGSVGVFNVNSTEKINLNITWLTGTMPYVSSDVIQSGTNTLAINNYGNGYTTYDDTIFNEDGSVKQRMILEISSSDAELITSYRII